MAKSTDAPDTLRPFIFHGCDINNDPVQATGSCPFCDAPKFSVKTETGQYRCLKCEETGNAYSFLFRLHQLSVEGTSESDYAALASLRKVTPASLIYFGVCRSRLTNEWLIPAYNIKGNLSNLYRVVQRKDEEGKIRLAPMSTPGCKPHPFGTHHLINHPKPLVWVAEGVWDGCALYDALTTYRQAGNKLIKTSNPDTSLFTEQGILPVPGCGNVDASWLEVLQGTEVRICFDNDHPKRYGPDHEKAGELIVTRGNNLRPGWDGMERLVKLFGLAKQKPKLIKVLLWNHPEQGHNEDLKDGYDLGDLFKDRPASVALRYLTDRLEQAQLPSPKKARDKDFYEQPAIEPIPCTSFEDLCSHWSAVLHFTQELRDTLATMLAVVLSTEAEKVNHLWLRVIGPPGSGKSTLAEAISVAREWVSPKSVITGFHSGFVDQTKDEPGTSSLIPELDNKTVVMKDGDTLVNSPNRDRILSELRDLYDGTSRAHYRTGQQDEFEDVRLSFILCGTDELRQLNRTFLGERFLDCEIMRRGEDAAPYVQRAGTNTYNSLSRFLSPKEADEADAKIPQDRMMFLKQVTYGFIKYLKENYKSFTPPAINATILSRLQHMGEYVALMRARIRHDHNEGSFRPRAELPTRLTSQFTKLAFFDALVLQKAIIDTDVIRLVLKVVHDTSMGLQQEITETLALDGMGTSSRQMTLGLNIPETTIRRQLSDMRQFGIAQPFAEGNNSGQRGRDRHLWCLTPKMRALWDSVFHLSPKEEPASDNRHSRSKRKRQNVDRKKTARKVSTQRNPRRSTR